MSELELYKGMVKKMKDDEIKEINIKIPGQILDYVDTKEHLLELYNYITNLQQENEKLLSENIVIKSVRNMIDEAIYKSRCEKASSLIEPLVEWGECTINGKILKSVYDILNGRSDE